MSASVRDAIIAATVAALDGVGKPTGLTVHRNRTIAIRADDLPAAIAYCLNESSERIHGREGSLTRHTLTLRAELRVKGKTTDAPDVMLDPLYVWAVTAVLTDTALRALIDGLEESAVEWEAASAEDHNYAAAAVDFTIAYATLAIDPTASAKQGG